MISTSDISLAHAKPPTPCPPNPDPRKNRPVPAFRNAALRFGWGPSGTRLVPRLHRPHPSRITRRAGADRFGGLVQPDMAVMEEVIEALRMQTVGNAAVSIPHAADVCSPGGLDAVLACSAGGRKTRPGTKGRPIVSSHIS